MPTYQLRSPNSGLPQSIVMATSHGTMETSTSHQAEEITRKREVRLMKNRYAERKVDSKRLFEPVSQHISFFFFREAARECRRKKKEYVRCLENRVAVLENQNKTLIEELKALKDLYCHKAE